jgi:WD40 repeat protein
MIVFPPVAGARRRPLLLSLALALGATGLLALALPPAAPLPAAELAPAEARAEAQLQRLAERLNGPSPDLPKLRKELLALRLSCPGTPTAVKAHALLGRLPSPLDRLERKTIPALERFDWQPKELVGVLGEHRGRHGAPVSCVAFSPDNSLIASGGSNLVRLWASGNMRLQATVGHGGVVTSLAFSRDSKALAVGGANGVVGVWDLVKGGAPRLRFWVSAASSPVYSVAFHPGNKVVAAGCHDNAVRLYDVSGKEAKELAGFTTHKEAVTAVAFSPDGKTLASGSNDKTVKLWAFDGTDAKERSVLAGHSAGLSAVAFSPSGRTLATGCGDGTIRTWALPAGPKPKERISHQGPKGAVTSLSFSASGTTLAATCGDNSVRLWSVGGGRFGVRGELKGHDGVVTGVAYSPDMRLLVSGGQDWTVRTWALKGPKPVERFVPWSHLSFAYSVAFSPDGQSLVSGSEDRVVRVWDLGRAEPRTRSYLKNDPPVPVYVVAYSPDGKRVAAAGQHPSVRQWDAGTGSKMAGCAGHPGAVFGLAYSPDGKRLLTGSEKELLLFDAVRGKELRRFPAHETRLTCMALSPDGRLALSGSGAYLYKDGKIVYKDGQPVYTDCVLKLWEVESGGAFAAVKDAKVPFYSATFDADGRKLFAGPYDALLRRWGLKGKGLAELPTWKGAQGHVHSMLVTPDGKSLVTRGLDGKVIVWDLPSGKRLHEWVFQENIGTMAASSDSRHLAVPLATGVVYVLRLRPAELRPR